MPRFDRDWLDKLLSEHGLRKKLMPNRYDEDDFDEDNEYDPQYVQWGSSDGSIFLPASKTVKELPPGCYEIDYNSQMGLFFEKIPVKTEGLIKFPDTTSNKVIGEIQKFWGRNSSKSTASLTKEASFFMDLRAVARVVRFNWQCMMSLNAKASVLTSMTPTCS
jgi:hypothetical protein